MPANYAHYRFGVEMLKLMPGDIRRKINRFRQLYDVGMHGPDIFFYYHPLRKTKMEALGRRLHMQSGADFFMRTSRSLRLEPSEAGEAYLYGVLTHYCLDSVCHPCVCEEMGLKGYAHMELESEFDRFLLEKDGKVPAGSQDLSPHMQLTPKECEIAARLYSGVTASQMQTTVKNMARITRLLAMPEGTPRKALETAIGLVSKDYLWNFIPVREPADGSINEKLFCRYEQAKERFPALLLQLSAHLAYNAPLGEDFEPEFG